ncbi:hypothetical protein SY91_00907 [Burkholderia cenocepacia]|uniref:hypothetical protein n=1 Tax=Burkholderia cepacia complex TaxID=87882 RepID=UPI0003C4311B|nr:MULTISPECIES: hypothetical protein [Burkholderia cepacia complex]ESS39335.1 hypothetical protein P355_3978 [Burkholderia cenocepacia KC-01]MBK1823919.1 hypothetical protein [Burkholderia orbicola]QND93536.1 hypothetical protein SY91_00907 [Burkholderia cenocepacia]
MGGKALVQHQVCIDLPGEPVKCAAETELTVLLRKHRDVVFDVKLQSGATYTVTTTHPDRPTGRFYDTRQKANVGKTTFNDGQLCHIWLGRTFEGSLILKQGDKVLGHYPIAKMDCTKGCTDDPKDKPAPVLIMLHNDKEWAKDLIRISDAGVLGNAVAAPSLMSALERARRAQPKDDVSSLLSDSPFRSKTTISGAGNVVRGEALNVSADGREIKYSVHLFSIKRNAGVDEPGWATKFFKEGDKPYEFKGNPHDVISRNWILAQAGSIGAYVRDAWYGNEPWARDFFKRSFFLIKRGGETVLAFSTVPEDWKTLGFLLVGYAREVRPGTKLAMIAGGAGSLSSVGAAAWNAAKESFSGNALIAFFIGAGIDAFVWFSDSNQDFRDLMAILLVDAFKSALVGAAISLINAGIVAMAAATGVTVGALAIGGFVLILGVGLLVDYLFDASGKKFVKLLFHNPKSIVDEIDGMVRRAGRVLEEKLPKDYGNYYSGSQWLLLP